MATKESMRGDSPEALNSDTMDSIKRTTASSRGRAPISAVLILTIFILGLLVDGTAAKRTIPEVRDEPKRRTPGLNIPKARTPTPKLNVPRKNPPKARTEIPKLITVIKPNKPTKPTTRPTAKPKSKPKKPDSGKPNTLVKARSPTTKSPAPKLNTPKPRALPKTTSRPSGMTTITTRARASAPSDAFFVAESDGFAYKGCFGHKPGELTGQVLGVDFIRPGNASMAERMTVPLCTRMCSDLASGFSFAGLAGGKDCYCGITLSSTAREVIETNCTSLCLGDKASYCGGTGHVLVYEFSSDSDSNAPFGAKTANNPMNSLIATASDTLSPSPSSSPTTLSVSDAPTANEYNPSGRSPAQTAAIVTGSLVGALVFTALAALAVKLYTQRHSRTPTLPTSNSYQDAKEPFDADYGSSSPHHRSPSGANLFSPSSGSPISPTSPQGKAGMGMAMMRTHSNRIVTPLTSPVHYRRRSSEAAGEKSPSTGGLIGSFPHPPGGIASGSGRGMASGTAAATSGAQPYDLGGSVSSGSAATVNTSILSVSTMHSSGRRSVEGPGDITTGVDASGDPYTGMPVSPISVSEGRSLTSPARVADPPGLGPRASNRRRFSRAFGPGDEEDGLGMGFEAEANQVGVARGSGIGFEPLGIDTGRDEDGMLPLVPAYTNWTVSTAASVSGKGDRNSQG